MIGIYKITNPNNKVYVGQSRNIEKRFLAYIRKNGKGQIRLNRSFIKYGRNNHKFEIIEECLFEELNIRERYWQDYYNVISEQGLNCILTATDTLPKEVSKETKLKLINNSSKYWLGKKKSKEIRKNMSNGQKNRTIYKEVTEETKIKISESKKGDKNPMFGIIGKNHHGSKKVINIETNEIYYSLKECCELNNLNPKYMSRWLNGSRLNKTKYKYV